MYIQRKLIKPYMVTADILRTLKDGKIKFMPELIKATGHTQTTIQFYLTYLVAKKKIVKLKVGSRYCYQLVKRH